MNMTIGKKLGAGIGVLLVLFTILGVVSFESVRKIDTTLKKTTELSESLSAAAYEMEINLAEASADLLEYLSKHDPIVLDRFKDNLGDFAIYREKYHALESTDAQRETGLKIDREFALFASTATTLIQLNDEQKQINRGILEDLIAIDDIIHVELKPLIGKDDPSSYEKLQAVMDIAFHLNSIEKDFESFMLTSDLQYTSKIHDHISDYKHLMENVYHRLPRTSEEEKLDEEKLEPLVNTSLASIMEIIEVGTKNETLHKEFIQIKEKLDTIMDEEIQSQVTGVLEHARKTSDGTVDSAVEAIVILLSIGLLIGTAGGFLLARNITRPIVGLQDVAASVARGDMEVDFDIRSGDEIGNLAASISTMVGNLSETSRQNERQNWLKTGLARINDVMRGDLDMHTLSSNIITEIATYLEAQVGAVYLVEERNESSTLVLKSSYAYTRRKNLSSRFKAGEGLIGQAAVERQQILVSNVPDDYVKVISGLGEAVPRFIAVTPFLFEGRVMGVIEVGTLGELPDQHLEYLSQAMEVIAINVQSSRSRDELADALTQTRNQAEELQAQQEELKAANEELEEQATMLKESEQRLTAQQEELQVANEELEEKNEYLERQKKNIETANLELDRTRQEIEVKAEELALASKYKSEFLANMSHELRTPLNSLLILSGALTDNKEGNLSENQVESARVIYESGHDLLSLIDEVLDLSKIEAGRMDVSAEEIQVRELAQRVASTFQHMADDKGLSLDVRVADDAPESILSDQKRVEQILKNLLSNAIKFTTEGGITVTIGPVPTDAGNLREGLTTANAVAFSVTDTGIGIPADRRKVIFEAFQQADGGTARKYGGTGLGLSISRELAHLLGGVIRLESEEDKGSTFTLYLPVEYTIQEGSVPPAVAIPERISVPGTSQTSGSVESIPDDRNKVKKGGKSILVIEDDTRFARLLRDTCHERGFKCLAAATGEDGLALATEFMPNGIILDIKLPGMNGWDVLDQLKNDIHTRHIPVHIMSVEEATIEAFRKGAIGFLKKPAREDQLLEAFSRIEDMFSRKVKDLLVVEDDDRLRNSIVKLVGNGDVHSEGASSGRETIEKLKSKRYDCIILDLGLPDMTGFDLLKKIEEMDDVVLPPVIVYTGRDLTREEDRELRTYAESVIIKGVRSEERLLDEASLFLHRVVDDLPKKKRQIIVNLHDSDKLLQGKKVLIVDDDMRNVFALSNTLTERGVIPLKAEDGRKALELLERESDVDLVLMDIMMPVMDGYETIKLIRGNKDFNSLPIIALTAKAMKGDRDRCLDAGASDYLPKPVDVNRLFSMMRVWLYR